MAAESTRGRSRSTIPWQNAIQPRRIHGRISEKLLLFQGEGSTIWGCYHAISRHAAQNKGGSNAWEWGVAYSDQLLLQHGTQLKKGGNT
jgi:hypothetical protein